MASLSDMILQQVKAATTKVEIPSNIKDTVVSGLSSSVLGSLTQTASKAGGIDIVKNLLTGKADAATSPVTSLATKLFTNNVLSGLKADTGLKSTLTGLVPTVVGKLGGLLKDQDGDGDVDVNDIIIALTGKNSSASVLGAAKGLLGGLFKK